MQSKLDFTADSNIKVSDTMQLFMVSLLKDVLVHPENLNSGKKQLKAYCENEYLTYRVVEHELDLFLALLADYRSANSPVLYYFLRLQAQSCFVGEHLFAFLPIEAPEGDYQLNCPEHSSYCPGTEAGSSVYLGGMVGGHLLGL